MNSDEKQHLLYYHHYLQNNSNTQIRPSCLIQFHTYLISFINIHSKNSSSILITIHSSPFVCMISATLYSRSTRRMYSRLFPFSHFVFQNNRCYHMISKKSNNSILILFSITNTTYLTMKQVLFAFLALLIACVYNMQSNLFPTHDYIVIFLVSRLILSTFLRIKSM